jgi:hypothetical protein
LVIKPIIVWQIRTDSISYHFTFPISLDAAANLWDDDGEFQQAVDFLKKAGSSVYLFRNES